MQIAMLTFMSRSGSTFVADLLARSGGCAVSAETDLFKHLSQLPMDRPESPEALLERFSRSRLAEDFVDPGRFLKCAASGEVWTHSRAARCAVRSRFDSLHDQVAVIKTRGPAWYLPAIARRIPELKVIHVLRDGRAVLNSQLHAKRPYRWGTMACEPLGPARIWTRWTAFVDHFAEEHPDRLLEVRFEDMVRDPDVGVERMIRFLGAVPRAVGQAKGDYVERIPDLERGLHENVGGKPRVEVADKWRDELDAGDVAVFELVASKALVRKGYEARSPYGAGLTALAHPVVAARLVLACFRLLVRRFENGVWLLLRHVCGRPRGSGASRGEG